MNTEIKIDSGIPVPPSGWTKPKYPWHLMNIGDSFFVPCDKGKTATVQATLYVSGRRHFRVATRRVEGGVRVWRIE